MSSRQDPYYTVKDEIQESIDALQSSFRHWERMTLMDTDDQAVPLKKELLVGCESLEWQVDELDKANDVAARDPAWYGIDEMEVQRRKKWSSTAQTQVRDVKKAIVSGNMGNGAGRSGMHRELMRMPHSQLTDISNHYVNQHDDDFISSESDRQLLLIKQQDEDLDELSESVRIIGGVGLTIHEELVAQERIIDGLGTDMDSTTNRLHFVQKKVGMVLKKASAKGQMMMILFLVVLFIILFVLVFLS